MSKLSELVTALAAAEQLEVLPDKDAVIARLQEQLSAELERLEGRHKCADCGKFYSMGDTFSFTGDAWWCAKCFLPHKERNVLAVRPLVTMGGVKP